MHESRRREGNGSIRSRMLPFPLFCLALAPVMTMMMMPLKMPPFSPVPFPHSVPPDIPPSPISPFLTPGGRKKSADSSSPWLLPVKSRLCINNVEEEGEGEKGI